VIVKRTDSDGADRRNADAGLMTETLRNADATGQATDEPSPAKATKSQDESMSLFWRVFGGTILSISALVVITLVNNVSATITDLRAEVAKVNEAKSDFARKDDLNALRGVTTTHAGYRAEIDNLRERASKYRLELDAAKTNLAGGIEALRKEQAAATEVLKKELTAVELLRDRLLTVTTDLKVAREELVKVRNDVDKNQAADNERRDRRDSQMKQLEETFKELAKTLQDTREKLARLEGQQKPVEVGPPARPKTGPPAPGGD